MKNLLLIFVLLITVSCKKPEPAKPAIPNYLSGTSWTWTNDTSIHMSFTADTLYFTTPHTSPCGCPYAYSYSLLSSNSFIAPAFLNFTNNFVISTDTLVLTNANDNSVNKYFKH